MTCFVRYNMFVFLYFVDDLRHLLSQSIRKAHMYEYNGKFGQVRLCRTCVRNKKIQAPFSFLGGGWHRCNDLYRFQHPHGVDFYMIFFSLTDGGRIRFHDKLHEIPASSITIVPPNTPLYYFTAQNQWWEFYWLNVGKAHTDILDRLISTHGYIYQSPRAVKIGKLVESLFPEQTVPDETIYEITTSRVLSNVFHLMLEDSYLILSKSHKNESVVPSVIQELEDNYNDAVSISMLAAKHFISLQHLIRLFKAETDLTPYEYLKKYRLKKATELLIYSDLSIEEIAKHTGFSAANNFVFQFKNEYGITPGKYRKFF